MNNYELFAHESPHGWSVSDPSGGRWWPDRDTQRQIRAAKDPAAEAVRICAQEPMRGRWYA